MFFNRMDFIPKNEYIGAVQHLKMINKQAIWVQCSSVIHAAMAWVTIVSYQSITIHMDIFWSIFFLLEIWIVLVAAEHSNTLGILTDTWATCERIRNAFIISTFIVWNSFTWPIYYYLIITSILCVVLTQIPQRMALALAVFTACAGQTYTVVGIYLLWSFSKDLSKQFFRKTIQKSIASTEIKRAYAFKSIYIILEGILLWNIRCSHRFPHVFRWKPLFFSFGSFAVAVLYGHFFIKETRISRNSIITREGHNMAASLNAAEQCPVCVKCLSLLDMESSFGS